MAVINHSVIIRNWGLGIGTIYLTVAVPIFSNCRKSFITPNGYYTDPYMLLKAGYTRKGALCAGIKLCKMVAVSTLLPTVSSSLPTHSGFKFVT